MIAAGAAAAAKLPAGRPLAVWDRFLTSKQSMAVDRPWFLGAMAFRLPTRYSVAFPDPWVLSSGCLQWPIRAVGAVDRRGPAASAWSMANIGPRVALAVGDVLLGTLLDLSAAAPVGRSGLSTARWPDQPGVAVVSTG